MSAPNAGNATELQVPVHVADLLRRHKELKQRQGFFQSRQVDFFRYKRFVRALKSSDYTKKSKSQPGFYPPITGETEEEKDAKAREVFITLIKSQLVVPAVKLHSHECKEHDLKPNKDFPNLILSNKATLQPNEYYVWNYYPKSIWDYLIVVGVVVGILALVCYPLWPVSMRRGSYYVSLGALGLLLVFFVVAIIRLVVYIFSLLVTKKETGGFWLFPNLFEDCGVIESFKPLYGFGEVDSYSYIKKMKRMKKKQAKKDALNEKKVTINAKPNSQDKKPKIEEVEDEQK